MHLVWPLPKPDGHTMTRAPALPHTQASADTQIDAAVLRLIDLLARQTAEELIADAPATMEIANAPPPDQND